MCRFGDAFRQAWQSALRGLDQRDANVALRVDAMEPIGDDFLRCAIDLNAHPAGVEVAKSEGTLAVGDDRVAHVLFRPVG